MLDARRVSSHNHHKARTAQAATRAARMNGHPRTDMGGHSQHPCALKFTQIARASCSCYHLRMLSACWTHSHVHMLLATDMARSVLTSGALHRSTCCPRVSTMRQTTEAQPCAVAYRAYNPDSKTPVPCCAVTVKRNEQQRWFPPAGWLFQRCARQQ